VIEIPRHKKPAEVSGILLCRQRRRFIGYVPERRWSGNCSAWWWWWATPRWGKIRDPCTHQKPDDVHRCGCAFGNGG